MSTIRPYGQRRQIAALRCLLPQLGTLLADPLLNTALDAAVEAIYDEPRTNSNTMAQDVLVALITIAASLPNGDGERFSANDIRHRATALAIAVEESLLYA